ncbi:MAG: glutaredoxin 3 [Minwuiales bacterium]|nr:glutaredoxin 3 [Minwuiales bacterium]
MADITMYTTPICPFCYRAKKLLSGKGVSINEVDVMMSPGKRDEMIARSGRRTVPQIFIGDTHVGGFDDLAALDRAGGLDPLLAAPA